MGKTRKKKAGLVVLVSLLLWAPALPAGAEPPAPNLNLAQAVELALRQHPSVKAAAEQVKAGKTKIGQARSAYLPQVALSAGYLRANNFQPQFGKRFDYYDYNASLNLSQNIYDFGRTAGQVSAARGNVGSLQQDYQLSRQTLVLRVKSAYWGLLATRRVLRATQEAVRDREALLRQASEFYAEGVKAKLDVTKAQADLASARSDLIKAENDVALAWEELQNSLGQELPPETVIQDELEAVAPSPKLSAALAQAFDRRPEWLRLKAQRQVGEGSLQTAFAGYLPSVSGLASYGYIEQALPPEERFWTAGVTVNLPLFTGFLTREQVAEARTNLRVLDENEADTRLEITKEVKEAVLNVTDGEGRVVAAREALAAARENLRVAETRYREGIGTIIEVTDAQAQAYQSETAYAQALYNLKISQAALDKAVGTPY